MKAHTQNTHTPDCTILTHKNHDIGSNSVVIGIDEVGRGSWFGQMTVAGVILDEAFTGEFGQVDLSQTPIATLNDSKKLTAKKRAQLFDCIKSICQSHIIIDVPAFVIDEIGIYQATLLAMRLASEHLIVLNHLRADDNLKILIDGNGVPTLSCEFEAFQKNIHPLIKGDGIHTAIACASILAKVHRDTAMNEYAKKYPAYHLDKHKGYGTKLHSEAIHEHGVLDEHRKSFNPIHAIVNGLH